MGGAGLNLLRNLVAVGLTKAPTTSAERLRRLQGARRTPAPIESLTDQPLVQAAFASPVGDRHRASLILDEANRSPVAALFSTRRPPDVARLIAAVVVDSVDGVLAGRSTAQVLKEPLKSTVTQPDGSYPDPSATVVRIVGAVLVAAARDHVDPGPILRGLGSLPGVAMSKTALLSVHRRPRAGPSAGDASLGGQASRSCSTPSVICSSSMTESVSRLSSMSAASRSRSPGNRSHCS